MTVTSPADQTLDENEELRRRLEEAEATIRAISGGEVDAFIVRKGADDQVLVLDGVDRPYRLLIEGMHQGAVTLAADGTIIYANKRLAELLKRQSGTVLGTALSDYVPPQDRPILADLLRRAQIADAEAELELDGGDAAVPVRLSASPLVEEAGIVCLVVTDLTEQRRQASDREHFVREQAARMAAEYSAAILREADRRKDEFLAMLAHELRGPLAPLRTGIEVLNALSGQGPTAQSTRDMMARQVENLVRLVNDLLDVSRVTQGKIELQKQRIDLRTVIQHAVETSRPMIEERKHRLELTLPQEPLPVEVDLTRMSQVILNLLTNAAKFTPAGGLISLTAERGPGEGEVTVRVRDTGSGIAPEMMSRIFELFAQADTSESRSEGGLGIGLTLSRRLVEMHGGSLEGFSEGPGQGSEFVVRLALSDHTVRAAGRQSPPAPQGAARRVLIVDDNRDAADSLAMLLRLRGHEMREEYDGSQCLAVAAEFRPDVVLLDIGLPGMTGYEVVSSLRASGILPDVMVFAVSGYGGEQQRERSLAAGFDEHLVKPVHMSVLDRLLASLQTRES